MSDILNLKKKKIIRDHHHQQQQQEKVSPGAGVHIYSNCDSGGILFQHPRTA